MILQILGATRFSAILISQDLIRGSMKGLLIVDRRTVSDVNLLKSWCSERESNSHTRKGGGF